MPGSIMGVYDTRDSGITAVVLTANGDKFVFTPNGPVDVVRWGIIVTTGVDVTGTGAVFSADKRPTAGSDTNRVAGFGGTITVGANDDTNVAGKVLYHECSPSVVQLDPGTQLVIAATTAPVTAGAGILFVHFRAQPWQSGRIANGVLKAA